MKTIPATETEEQRIARERIENLTGSVADFLSARVELAHAEKESQSARTGLFNAFCDYQNMKTSTGAAKPATVVVTVTTGKFIGQSFLLIDKGASHFDVVPIEIVK